MTTRTGVLDFYACPSAMTASGKHAPLLGALPADVAALARLVSGLVLYEYVASDFYGVTIAEERKTESHIRSVEAMLDRLLALDDRPLDVTRPFEKRLVGICHHFALLHVAMLRARGVPARVRGGFGAYFNPPYFEDHWVSEYWNETEARWVLVDAQLDVVWRERLAIDFDPLDVPRDRFVVAHDAWSRCRSGEADASKFGIFKGEMRGLWFIAGSLIRDVAALNKTELLPWDVWGAMPDPDASLDGDEIAFFDRLAALTRQPDAAFADLRTLFESDDRVRVPETVFNAVLQRSEAI